MQFANAVKISHPKIDEQVCATKDGSGTAGTGYYGTYSTKTTAKTGNFHSTALCGGKGERKPQHTHKNFLRNLQRKL
ncbi:hypothetical protein APHMUC_1333 [Anaplasma phagocytophilum str. ApMUC09]|uniref:Uncharacterized protein n=1 Tax=Anaplasma phagocytophilum str. ApMUC09 TaxID=1359152 RepID=A0A0F3N931_ANAPH|nr:hypothetical protein APHMUC_1333 [Anaplasma phagocytophilum str. ApMUC09]